MASENKTKATEVPVEEFMAGVSPARRKKDGEALIEMMREITGHEPKMWGPSIIGFGSVHYKYASGREGDWPILGFSPRKASLSIYLCLGDMQELHGHHLAKLGKHRATVGCLYINKLDDVNLAVLHDMLVEAEEYNRTQWDQSC